MAPVVFWGLVALVALAPLPYGAVHPWSSSLLILLTAVLLLLWGGAAAMRREIVPDRRLVCAVVPYALFVCWVMLQAAPWMPAALHHPLWTEMAEILNRPPGAGAISLNPSATLETGYRLAAYGAIFVMAATLSREPDSADRALWAIAIAGFLYAGYGLWVELDGGGTILFTDKWAYHQSLTSTLVNRNHYAFYAGIGLMTAFGLLIRYAQRDASGAFDGPVRFLFALENLRLRVFVLMVVCGVIATALVLTKSRGGLAFTGAGLVALVVLLGAGARITWRSAVLIIGVLVLAGIVLVSTSGEEVLLRAVWVPSPSGRGPIHDLAMEAIRAAPLTGHGAGSFPAVFHLFRGEAFPAISPAYAAAHSVYLETLAETGLIGGGLLFASLAIVLWACLTGTRRRRRHVLFPALGGAVLIFAALHGTVDFGPNIPGISATLALILGIAYGQAWPANGGNGGRGRNAAAQSRDR